MRRPPPFPTYTLEPEELELGDRILFGTDVLELVDRQIPGRPVFRARHVDGFELPSICFNRPTLVVSREK